MAKVNMIETAAGVSEHPWINNPDTKFQPSGVFKNTVWFDGALPTTLNLIALIDDAAKEAFDRQLEGLSAAERKKWSLYAPYEREMDDETGDTPTGRVKFGFKRNHTIKLQGGEEKLLTVAVYDSKGKVIDPEDLPPIYSGTVLKTLFSFRDVKVPGTKQAGVKLDMAAVKIISLGKGGRSADPFSKDDGPDADDGYEFSPKDKRPAGGSAQQGDDNEQSDF